MSVSYKQSSPYYSTVDNGAYLDIIQFRNIPSLPDDSSFEILSQYENRPDLLAYDLYNDVNLWWVFAVRNKDIIKDPVFDMVSGVIIKIPQLTTLKSVLGI
jgi:hypothetical protein